MQKDSLVPLSRNICQKEVNRSEMENFYLQKSNEGHRKVDTSQNYSACFHTNVTINVKTVHLKTYIGYIVVILLKIVIYWGTDKENVRGNRQI
jgi:hypothetical protein